MEPNSHSPCRWLPAVRSHDKCRALFLHGPLLSNPAARPLSAVERHKHPPSGRQHLADGELFCGFARWPPALQLSASFSLTNVADPVTYVPVTLSTDEVRPRIVSRGSPASQTVPLLVAIIPDS